MQLFIEGICHGNLLEEEAIHISDIFKSNLPVQPIPVEMRHQEHIICLPSGANLVRDVSVKNKCETNSVVEVAENGQIIPFFFRLPFIFSVPFLYF